jgi:hypothetical protein
VKFMRAAPLTIKNPRMVHFAGYIGRDGGGGGRAGIYLYKGGMARLYSIAKKADFWTGL